MTAIALAPFAPHPIEFTDLGRLRVQECERVLALRTELSKCGALISESGDSLSITPGPLHGATLDTWNDHRIAMCFAMLGLRVPGIRLHNPACVRKTFPNFFAKLASLGASILDASGQPLSGPDLLAD
jgi:3-phosphoshikimate 1-carboxyvinyltransferase